MSSDKFDKKVIEAAGNHHPPYDENGWRHMERLLDKHLPQKEEKKRRFIFFLIFFLLFGGAGIWYFSGINKSEHNKITGSANKISNSEQQPKKILTNKDIINKKKNSNTQLSENGLVTSEKPSVVFNNDFGDDQRNKPAKNNDKVSLVMQHRQSSLPGKRKMNWSRDRFENKNEPEAVISELRIGRVDANEKTDKTNWSVIAQHDKQVEERRKNADTNVIITKAVLDEKQDSDSSAIKKVKTKNNKRGIFFLSISAGPDLSFAGGNKAGTARLLGGAGFGYTLKNGITIKTGFYSGRKIYSASPDSYNPPPAFTQYYPILEKVDADCKVYEIPVAISYNFGKSEKQKWFGGAGLSTLLMKKEKYTYTYKYTSAGPSYTKDWTIYNQNEHYFSILTLSGGFERQLSKSVSISAEPYVKIPLQGIGYGKVKLNSTGIMFNLSVKPFRSKANK